MKDWKKQLMTWICSITWGVLFIIILGGVISHFSAKFFSIYSRWLSGQFILLWSINAIFLIMAIIFYDTYTWEIRKKEYLSPKKENQQENQSAARKETSRTIRVFPGVWILIMLIPAFIVVTESYILLDTATWMWILLLVLSLLAIVSKIVSKTPPENRVLRLHFAFIISLSIILVIFQGLLLSNHFKKTYLNASGAIDRCLFAGAALHEGKPAPDMLKEKINAVTAESISHNTPVSDYLDIFAVYIHQLQNNSLAPALTPPTTINGKTIHSLFIDKAWIIAYAKKVLKSEKQKVLETLLDYLYTVVEKKHLDSINNQNETHPLDQAFFLDLDRLINTLTRQNELTDPVRAAAKKKKFLDAVRSNYPDIIIY